MKKIIILFLLFLLRMEGNAQSESCNCTDGDKFTGDPYIYQVTNTNQLGSIACGGTLPVPLECNKKYSFDIPTQWMGILQTYCRGADSIVIKNGNTVITSVPNHPISYTFTTSGTYSVNYYLKKNGVVCRTCIMYFNVNCPPPCICPAVSKPTLSWQAGTNIDSKAELALTCGETLTDKLDCFKPYLIGLKNPCGENCTPEEVITKITYPNGSVVTSTNLNGADLIANQVGTYTVSMKVKCNGKWCDECIVKFKQTKKCEPPCDNCKEKVGAKFNKNASSATVSTYPAATTINAVISLDGGTDTYTEVRANIVDFNIFAENNACLKSYTSPNDWGSIVAGTLGGFNPIVTNYAGVSSSSLANNPREIVFGSQSPVAITSNAPLNLTIKIPGVNPLSCCCINSTIFIKITYRNNKCEECSKIIRIDANQCPDTDKGGTINFNPIAGSPQFRTQGINKTDAESLKSASKTGLKK